MSESYNSGPPPFDPQRHSQDPLPPRSSGLAWKILLGLLGGGLVLLLLCVGVGYFALRNVVNFSPAQVRAVASEIAVLEVPEYFHPMMVMSFPGLRMAVFRGEDNRGMFALMDAEGQPGTQDRAQFERMMRVQWDQQMQQQGRGARDELESKTETFKIRGAPVELQVLKSDDDGSVFYEVSGVFDGANGQAFLGILAPEEQVDSDALRQMIESIE